MLRRLEAASGSPTPEEAQATIRATIDEIEGVLDTFNALLRIGQIEAGARRAAFRPLDLAEVAREVVEAFQPAAEEEGKIACLPPRRGPADAGATRSSSSR